MAFTITERLLPPGMNRPGTAIKVRGVISHITGNASPSADALSHYNYFAGANRNGSAHYFTDHQTILRIIPESEMAWHAGLITNPDWRLGNPNTWAVGVEMCQNYPFMSAEGDMAYRKYVWLHADICRRYGLDPRQDIYGHFEIDPVNRGNDPKAFFNWDMFIEDVAREHDKMGEVGPPANADLLNRVAVLEADNKEMAATLKQIAAMTARYGG